MRRRAAISGLFFGVASYSRWTFAAPVTRALGLRQLVDASLGIVAAVPQLVGAEWVDVFGARRIVSVWQLSITEVFHGALPSESELVTLGGSVGQVQQLVAHEAKLSPDEQQLLFVRPGPLGRCWVSGMFQGAYALSPAEDTLRVRVSPDQAELLGQPGSAVGALDGLELAGVRRAIVAARDT